MKALKEVLETIERIGVEQAIFLCLCPKKHGGNRAGRHRIPVKVLEIKPDHIIVCPKDKPGRRLSISPETRVSKLLSSSLNLNF